MSRILVVDDMEFNRHHLRKILESDDFEVETVGDGRSAWERLRVQKYDLVITDLRMPELSGLELLAKVRAERLPVGVIVLTAFGDPTEALRAMKAGADDFVAKPYEPDHLRLLDQANSRSPRADRRARATAQADARRLSISQRWFPRAPRSARSST